MEFRAIHSYSVEQIVEKSQARAIGDAIQVRR